MAAVAVVRAAFLAVRHRRVELGLHLDRLADELLDIGQHERASAARAVMFPDLEMVAPRDVEARELAAGGA